MLLTTDTLLVIVTFCFVVLCVGAFIAYNSFYLVKQAELIIVERFGRFDRILQPGLHFLVPFVECPRMVTWTYIVQDIRGQYLRKVRTTYRIDIREMVDDFPKQHVITKDNVTMEINALLYYYITDAKAAVYQVVNLPEAIEKLTQTTLRNVIGSMELDESLVSRDQINEKLRVILDEATDKWGVKVNRVELQEVNPPKDIRQAMEKQMRAERDRRAKILEAEGIKRSAILEAEGQKESRILQAQGDAESRVLAAEADASTRFKIAQAEAQALQEIQKAIPNADPMAYQLSINYIKTLPELMQGKNDKLILMPYEAASFAGSVASLKKIFEQS